MQVLSKTKSATTIKISDNLVVKTYSNTVPLEISKNFILKYIVVSKHIDCLPEVVKYNEKTIITKYETHIPFWRYVLSSPNNLNKLVKKFIDIQFSHQLHLYKYLVFLHILRHNLKRIPSFHHY